MHRVWQSLTPKPRPSINMLHTYPDIPHPPNTSLNGGMNVNARDTMIGKDRRIHRSRLPDPTGLGAFSGLMKTQAITNAVVSPSGERFLRGLLESRPSVAPSQSMSHVTVQYADESGCVLFSLPASISYTTGERKGRLHSILVLELRLCLVYTRNCHTEANRQADRGQSQTVFHHPFSIPVPIFFA
ncbi:hypothetical protein N656DRAFT_478529 [Canariomyces notabilis]|uniref:Uncharacterized protein n=1 Tax=Canariomyces notabilis TaxID=2074819 RepID=A0AAN6YV92_9PEZI|nr:hypothetical protein N656DRAFT_478529 [Canariomyces arenarius]